MSRARALDPVGVDPGRVDVVGLGLEGEAHDARVVRRDLAVGADVARVLDDGARSVALDERRGVLAREEHLEPVVELVDAGRDRGVGRPLRDEVVDGGVVGRGPLEDRRVVAAGPVLVREAVRAQEREPRFRAARREGVEGPAEDGVEVEVEDAAPEVRGGREEVRL